MTDWRDDPNWKLVRWATNVLTEQPKDKPPKIAELSADGFWCDVYRDHRPIATWFRETVHRPQRKARKEV